MTMAILEGVECYFCHAIDIGERHGIYLGDVIVKVTVRQAVGPRDLRADYEIARWSQNRPDNAGSGSACYGRAPSALRARHRECALSSFISSQTDSLVTAVCISPPARNGPAPRRYVKPLLAP